MDDNIIVKDAEHGDFVLHVVKSENGTLYASLRQRPLSPSEQDGTGALYYVVVIILLYGCSILMMIASHIRKNNVDRKLNRSVKFYVTFYIYEAKLFKKTCHIF